MATTKTPADPVARPDCPACLGTGELIFWDQVDERYPASYFEYPDQCPCANLADARDLRRALQLALQSVRRYLVTGRGVFEPIEL